MTTVPGSHGTDTGLQPPNMEALAGLYPSSRPLLLSWGVRFWSYLAALFPFLLDGGSRLEVAWLLPTRVWVGLELPAGDQRFMDTDAERLEPGMLSRKCQGPVCRGEWDFNLALAQVGGWIGGKEAKPMVAGWGQF